jgi:hypothetical protein
MTLEYNISNLFHKISIQLFLSHHLQNNLPIFIKCSNATVFHIVKPK